MRAVVWLILAVWADELTSTCFERSCGRAHAPRDAPGAPRVAAARSDRHGRDRRLYHPAYLLPHGVGSRTLPGDRGGRNSAESKTREVALRDFTLADAKRAMASIISEGRLQQHAATTRSSFPRADVGRVAL